MIAVAEHIQFGSTRIDYDVLTEVDTTYDIYIPADYDHTQPYGLVVFINSKDKGGHVSDFQPVLNDKNLIWLAVDNAGNGRSSGQRVGRALAGAYRMRELLNIDDERIYCSGNSGGQRTCMAMAFAHPEISDLQTASPSPPKQASNNLALPVSNSYH